MSEPFGLDDAGARKERDQGSRSSSGNLWSKLGEVWKAIWSQSLFVKRHGETVIQLPLALAILLAVAFPHAAALLLVIGVLAGYSISVTSK